MAFPLKSSKNRRYLVDQRNTPFLLVGDSPQAMIGNLSVRDAASFIANRKAAGFNALWVNLLCATYTGCRDDGTTFDGIAPFTTPGDLSTPDPAYFARADAIIRLAARAGIAVFLNPIETGGWLTVLRNNGPEKARAYGRFLGERYKSFANIVWFNGNDFQDWADASNDAVVLAVAEGIRAADPAHLQTVELDAPNSGSLDDPRWRSVVTLDAAYTYYPTYAQVLKEYNRSRFVPVFMAEARYEFEGNPPDYGDPPILRREAYWSMLSGAAGQFYGNHYTWPFAPDWQNHLDTPGSRQITRLKKLFSSLPWFRLIPDQRHRVVTAGYGTFSVANSVAGSDYVTTAATPDRKLAISYLPAGGAVVVDLTRFAGSVRARWYDPTNGTYTPSKGTPFRNTHKIRLTAPGRNSEGSADWVLVLTAR